MPDPIVDPADGTDPEHEALLGDAVGLALLVVPETLSPASGTARSPCTRRRARLASWRVAAGERSTIGAISRRSSPRGARAVRPALVNGAVGAVTMRGGEPFSVGGVIVRGGRIVELDILADPERLRRLDLTVLGG